MQNVRLISCVYSTKINTRFDHIFFSQTEAHLDTLISEQASFILARSGVGSLYTVYQENRGQKVRTVLTLKSSEL